MAVIPLARFEVFTAMKIQDDVAWIMTMCSDVVGYQRFEGITHVAGYHLEDGNCMVLPSVGIY
jgi:hypothetical protein